MTIYWKKYCLTIGEIYGKETKKTKIKNADIHAYFQQNKPVQSKTRFSIHRKALNLCINLNKPEKILLKEMNRTTRYKIRRARKDNVIVECIDYPDINDVKRFVSDYNPFAKAKGIGPCKLGKLISLMENNMLVITSVYHQDGRKLASNATIAKHGIAIGLYGYSLRFINKNISGQFISRANRYLHWRELMFFKSLGYHTFDFMGLTIDKNNVDHQNINKFKRSFGGEERIEYQSFIPQNIKGIILILILRFLWRNNLEVIRNEQLPLTELTESAKDP